MSQLKNEDKNKGIRADQATGIIVAVGGLVLALWTTQIDVLASQSTLSARFFPFLLAAIFIFAGLTMILKPAAPSLGEVLKKLLSAEAFYFAALFLIYALTFRFVDFRVSTWVFMMASMWILGARNRLELLILPVVVSAGVFTLFRYGFTVVLPTWM